MIKERLAVFKTKLVDKINHLLLGQSKFSSSRRNFLRDASAFAVMTALPFKDTQNAFQNTELPVSQEDYDFLIQNEIFSGDPNKNNVALTYDDFGSVEDFHRVLDDFKSNNMRATFFLNGSELDHTYVEVMNRLVAEGHELGCHGYTHDNMTELSDTELRYNFNEFLERVAEFLPNYKVKYFRAPFGARNPRELKVAAELGLQSIMWNVVSPGTESAYSQTIKGIQQNGNGSIILAHISRNGDVNAVSDILTWLKENELSAQTISEVIPTNKIRPSERKNKSKKVI